MADGARLSHFSSFMPALSQSPERGLKTTRLLADEWRTSAVQRGDKLSQSLQFIYHPRLLLLTPPSWFCTVTQTRSAMYISLSPSDRRHFWLIFSQTSGTMTPARLWSALMTTQCRWSTDRGRSNPCFRLQLRSRSAAPQFTFIRNI